MTILYLLIPVTIIMGVIGLAPSSGACSGQYEDLAGAAERVLHDFDTPPPIRRKAPASARSEGERR